MLGGARNCFKVRLLEKKDTEAVVCFLLFGSKTAV